MQRITYLQSNVKENRLIRWMDNSFPLKFYAAPFRWYKAQNEGYKYQALVKRALEAWERASNGKVRFTMVNTLLESQVNLDWKRIDRQALGHCYFNFDNAGRLYSAEVQIGLSDGTIHARYQDENEVYHTILHEIGHALGIMGHSYSSDDLMYMSTQPNSNITRYRSDFQFLSQDDLNTINLLYKLIPDISNVPMSKFKKEGLIYAPIVLGNEKDINKRKIEEAKNYIESAPELPGGYIDLAIAYAEIEKYSDAIATLREALEHAQTDNDRYIIYYNIAVIHLNSNRLEEAEKYINMAKDLNSSDEILELESNLNHAKASNKKPFRTNLSN